MLSIISQAFGEATLRKVLRWIGFLSLAFVLFFYFLLPTASIQRSFGSLGEALLKSQNLLLGIGIFSAAVLFIFSEVLGFTLSREQRVSQERRPTPSILLGLLIVVLSFGLCLRSCFQINRPLDFDEHFHGANLAQGEFQKEFTPFVAWNHLLAQGMEAAALELFGVSKISYRLVSFLFCALLLIFVSLFLWRDGSYFCALLVLGHLLANSYATWFFISARGYVSLLATSFILFYLAYEATHRNRLRPVPLFGAAILAVGLTHLFGVLFAGSIWLSLLFWTWGNRSFLSGDQTKILKGYLKIGFFALLVLSVIAAIQAFALSQVGDLGGGASVAALREEIFALFGLRRAWEGRLVILLALSLIFYATLSQRSLKREWLSIFVILSVGLLTALVVGMQVRVLMYRFLLPFWIPALFWVGYSISRSRHKAFCYGFQILSMGILIGLPFRHRLLAPEELLNGGWVEYDRFVTQVSFLLRPVEDKCLAIFAYSHPNEKIRSRGLNHANFARNFHFQRAHTHDCEPQYGMIFGIEGDRAALENTLPPDSEVLLFSPFGMALYRPGASFLLGSNSDKMAPGGSNE